MITHGMTFVVSSFKILEYQLVSYIWFLCPGVLKSPVLIHTKEFIS